MIKLIDVVYHSHNNVKDPLRVLELHAPSLGFVEHIKHKLDIQFIKHMDHEGIQKINDVQYIFFKRPNKFFQIPFKTHNYIKSQKPDVIIVQGLIFPLQVIALRMKVGKDCKIIIQHHGEKPFKGIKKIFQKIASKYIDAYLFTAIEISTDWVRLNIINASKCFEILPASTWFTRLDKNICKEKLGLKGTHNFLWVGRLNTNKDPITVMKAFEKYVSFQSDARLHMVFQTNDLLDEVFDFIKQSDTLASSVYLHGKITHSQLPYWYSAADFYISASHNESCGYALLEAMACGCIPIVTSIPSFKKITGNGKYGFLFPAGEPDALLKILCDLKKINREQFSENVRWHFNNILSYKNIADDLYNISCSLIS